MKTAAAIILTVLFSSIALHEGVHIAQVFLMDEEFVGVGFGGLDAFKLKDRAPLFYVHSRGYYEDPTLWGFNTLEIQAYGIQTLFLLFSYSWGRPY